jgi:chemotaxis protein MotB
MTEPRVSKMPQGSALASLGVIVALLIGALYYFAYVPQRNALIEANLAAAAASEAADAARLEASERARDSAEARERIEDLEGMLEDLRQTSAGLEAQVREREAELADTMATQDELISVLQMEILNGQIQVARMRDSLRVNLVNEILFDSGEAALKPAGIEVLRRVGEILKTITDKQIIVQGHTDYVTIGGRLAQRYPTNWELSSARAVNVVRLLQEEIGVDPTRLAATGLSEHRPRADNSTEEGRRLNRRIEILLAPMPEPVPATD